MDKKELLRVVKEGESEKVEFKRSFAEIDRAIQTLVAFANANGGIVIFGVGNNGSLVGIDIGQNNVEQMSNKIVGNTEPQIYPSIDLVTIDGKTLVTVKVGKGTSQPYMAFGKPYKRVGKTTVQMKREELKRLFRKNMPAFDIAPVEDATSDDIDREKVDWFLKRRAEVRNLSIPKASIEQILINLNCLTGDLVPTWAGILFFGKEPQQFLSRSQLKMARFKGTTRLEFIDRAELEGTLPEMLDEAERFIRRNTRRAHKVVGFRGTSIYEYPYKALREAMVNALVHRDYRMSGSTQVMIFDDRVEVQSPGGLPEGIDIKNLEGKHRPRNDILCERFHDIDEMEEYGTGITKMKNWMKGHGLRVPKIQEKAEHFIITFYGPGDHILDLVPEEGVTDLKALGLNERQVKALALMVNERKVLTNKTYRELFGVTSKTATRDLTLLTGTEFVQKTGGSRNIQYRASE
ncbi:MAG: helix-turn-helix domain-containing protein [Actinobacteria bacterium]|nr:helix-turn-helix domain-containing protein [Actinomycetota bacterium]